MDFVDIHESGWIIAIRRVGSRQVKVETEKRKSRTDPRCTEGRSVFR
jgi:hypothetical protein